MQLHQLSPTIKNKGKKRIGRGGKKGGYSGKGIKGQKSRAGRKFQPIMRELIKRYPKLRGYRHIPKPQNIVAVSFDDLKNFSSGEKVSPQVLLDKGIVRRIRGKAPRVKIIVKGALDKKLIFEDCLMSKKAKEAIDNNLKSKK